MSFPAYGVALDRRPSMDVGKSRPMASAFTLGWAAAEFDLCPAATGPSEDLLVLRTGVELQPGRLPARSGCRPLTCRSLVRL